MPRRCRRVDLTADGRSLNPLQLTICLSSPDWYFAAIRKYMNEHKSAFDPRDYLKPAREAAKTICKARYEQFGCAGMGSKIKPVPLDRIAAKYKSGELRQIVN